MQGKTGVNIKSWGEFLKNDIFEVKKTIESLDTKLLHNLFPSELMDFFEIKEFQTLCSLETKTEYWLIDFEEKNQLPSPYSALEYETKDFMESKFIQDFPLRGKAVFFKIRKRRWRHKQTQEIIKGDFTFIADGSKFTQELSDFLKDTGGYARRYHDKHSQLLPGE